MALEVLPAEQRQHSILSDAPFVEGAVVAAVEASLGKTLRDVATAAVAVCEMPLPVRETDEEKSHGTFSSHCTNSVFGTFGPGAF